MIAQRKRCGIQTHTVIWSQIDAAILNRFKGTLACVCQTAIMHILM